MHSQKPNFSDSVTLSFTRHNGDSQKVTCKRCDITYEEKGEINTLCSRTEYSVAPYMRSFTNSNKEHYARCVYVTYENVKAIVRLCKNKWRVVRFVKDSSVIMMDDRTFWEESTDSEGKKLVIYNNPSGLHYHPDPGFGPVHLTFVMNGLYKNWHSLEDQH